MIGGDYSTVWAKGRRQLPLNLRHLLDTIYRLNQLLNRRGRLQIIGLMLCSCVSGLLELCGVTSTLPFMALASNPELINGSGRVHQIYLAVGCPSARLFLVMLGLVILGSLTLSNILVGLASWLGLKFAAEQQRRLSLQLFQSYLGRPYLWHVQNHPATLGYNLGQARALVGNSFNPVVQLISRLGNMLLLIGVVVYLNPLVALLSLTLLVTLYGSAYVVCRRQLLADCAQEWKLGEVMGRTVSEPIAGIKHIRLAGVESRYLEAYSDQLYEMGEIQRRKLVSVELPRLVIQTLTYGSILGLVIYLVYLHGGGENVIGQVSLYALAGYRLIPNIQQYFQSLAQLESGRVSLDRLYADLMGPLPELPQDRPSLPVLSTLALADVTFSYGQENLFQQLNLSIAKNACVGFVGPTGKGKTTLVNLLVGLLQPQKGELQVDGQSLGPADLRAYQRNIGYVPQDIYLCDDTLWHNIALGEETPDRERVSRAAQAARVDEFADDLPQGMDTLVGERGVRLSGGQRQRVGIARALYRDPQVLVFDEATSALDGVTEAEVMQAIARLAHTRTILIVAHRLSTVRDCDLIYYVDAGGIVAQGSYQELLDGCPQFQALATSPPS